MTAPESTSSTAGRGGIVARLACVSGALAVTLGAFGAHALRSRLAEGLLEPRDLEIWETAVFYQFVHALALLLVSGWMREGRPGTRVAAGCFMFGTVIFSGSLYAMTLGAPKWFGAITPIGGVAFIAGWLFAAWAAGRAPVATR